jgi:hypothetical protein
MMQELHEIEKNPGPPAVAEERSSEQGQPFSASQFILTHFGAWLGMIWAIGLLVFFPQHSDPGFYLLFYGTPIVCFACCVNAAINRLLHRKAVAEIVFFVLSGGVIVFLVLLFALMRLAN